jgi:hypothetical protein
MTYNNAPFADSKGGDGERRRAISIINEKRKANVHTQIYPYRTTATQARSITNTTENSQERNPVVYWAGMRIEGPLRPFKKR